jgi:hypothetical protein
MASSAPEIRHHHHHHHRNRNNSDSSGYLSNSSGSASLNSISSSQDEIMAQIAGENGVAASSSSVNSSTGAFFTWQRFLPAIFTAIVIFFTLIYFRPSWILDDKDCLIISRLLFWTIASAVLVFFMPWIVSTFSSLLGKKGS